MVKGLFSARLASDAGGQEFRLWTRAEGPSVELPVVLVHLQLAAAPTSRIALAEPKLPLTDAGSSNKPKTNTHVGSEIPWLINNLGLKLVVEAIPSGFFRSIGDDQEVSR